MPCDEPHAARSVLRVSEPHPGARALAEALPDVPRWLEVRAMLVLPAADLYVSPEGFVVRLPSAKRAAAVGKPEPHLFDAALERVDPGWRVLVAPEDADHVAPLLAGFSRERALVHVLSGPTPHLQAPDPDVFELGAADLDRLPESVAEEIARFDFAETTVLGLRHGSVIASIAYAAWQTQRLYAVAVTTLGPHRKRGFGERVVRALLDRRDEVQRPVWSSAESNVASLRLAARLGFRPFDELVVFSPQPVREPTN